MNDDSNALRRLAGLSDSRMKRTGPGLSEREIQDLCGKIDIDRSKARMTANEFLALDRGSLMRFCARFGFARADVRLAQCLDAVVRATCRTSGVAAYLSRMRLGGHSQGALYQ